MVEIDPYQASILADNKIVFPIVDDAAVLVVVAEVALAIMVLYCANFVVTSFNKRNWKKGDAYLGNLKNDLSISPRKTESRTAPLTCFSKAARSRRELDYAGVYHGLRLHFGPECDLASREVDRLFAQHSLDSMVSAEQFMSIVVALRKESR